MILAVTTTERAVAVLRDKKYTIINYHATEGLYVGPTGVTATLAEGDKTYVPPGIALPFSPKADIIYIIGTGSLFCGLEILEPIQG